MNFFIGFFLIFITLLSGCDTDSKNQHSKTTQDESVKTMYIKNIPVTVEIPVKGEDYAKGLMYRKHLPDSCGMLFVFNENDIQSFWMKNTLIPLSIAFIDNIGRIVDIQDMEPHDENLTQSRYPAMFALEMNQGWLKKRNIKVGDKVKLP